MRESEWVKCAECGRAFRLKSMGRPARYCGVECRSRAQRARAKASDWCRRVSAVVGGGEG